MSFLEESLRPSKAVIGVSPGKMVLAGFKLSMPAILLILLGLIYYFLPNAQKIGGMTEAALTVLALAGIYMVIAVHSRYSPARKEKLDYNVPLITAGCIFIILWELCTLKSNFFPMPFFPSIVKILSTFGTDWDLIGIGILYSLRLWALGFFSGLVSGILTGLALGWSKRFHYWVYPLLKMIGPIPSIAWIPIFMAVLPTSFWASVFLITFGTWFAMTILTWSGVANVNKAYYEVARTLGASDRYILRHIVWPASLPVIFVGLFKALSGSFIVLVTAEMLGVRAGLGWYQQWSYSWSQYYKVYATLIVMAILFSSITTLLFKVRDKVLVWQKGMIEW